MDQTLRIKIIDDCGLACVFCHNEGTPVTGDNRNRTPDTYRPAGRSGRVSIYVGANGARFLAAPIHADTTFTDALDRLVTALHVTDVHLTGGEPTLHPQLASLVAMARGRGLRVGVTSNGERGAQVMTACAEAGLSRINFSVFGTTAGELAQVQHPRLAKPALADRKITALRAAITAADQHGVPASANIVVPDHSHAARVHRLLAEYPQTLSVRLLNSLDHGHASIAAIEAILDDLDAEPVRRHLIAGVSAARTHYRMPSGREVIVKQLLPVRLPTTCAGCRFNNGTDCHEGFYGVRLYRDTAGVFQVGVCIQRMDLCVPLDEFVAGDLCREVLALRDSEYRQLSTQHAS